MNVIMPLPNKDFDPTESAIVWKVLHKKGIAVTFATLQGAPANADQYMLDGKGLGLFSKMLVARKEAISAYRLMQQQQTFLQPLKYKELTAENFDGLILPGGHAKGMIPYLESKVLQKLVVDFFSVNKLVAAVCHGVLLVARSIDPATKKSVLYNKQTTSLLKSQERTAYQLTRFWMKDYYLTYPITVEDEVRSFLATPQQFKAGTAALFRDSPNKLNRGFVVQDGNYISARWPGDIYCFANKIIKYLNLNS